TGTHAGHLWSSAAQLLADVTFGGESATGWQQADFAFPVRVTAGTTYIVSYTAPNAGYAYDGNFFASAAQRGPLTAPADGPGGANGVYAWPGFFPKDHWGASNYWVDAVFTTTDNVAPAVTSRSPAAGATDAAL